MVKHLLLCYVVAAMTALGSAQEASASGCWIDERSVVQVLTIISIKPWQKGDPLPPPDVIGMTTADMVRIRYRLANDTNRSLFYLADSGTILPSLYSVHRAAERDDWQAPFRGREGFLTGSFYNWLELPPRTTIEFERVEWFNEGQIEGRAMFVNGKPQQKDRRETISTTFHCKKTHH